MGDKRFFFFIGQLNEFVYELFFFFVFFRNCSMFPGDINLIRNISQENIEPEF